MTLIDAPVPLPQQTARHERVHKIGMPQMVLSGLSENWLIKEIGDYHWELIGNALNSNTAGIKDAEGRRVYATIIGIHIKTSYDLSYYKENDQLLMSGNLLRVGNNKNYSNIFIRSSDIRAEVGILSAFATKSNDSVILSRSVPADIARIPRHYEPVELSDIYRQEKKKILQEEKTGVVFETEYSINPYTDINGVNLLYFASYPLINDICEADFFNARLENATWPLESYLNERRVFYFGNCNHADKIIYRLHHYQVDPSGTVVTLESSLWRKQDNKCIASIHTVKKLKRKFSLSDQV
ncbi:Pnap_2097 family protein [Chitinophaga nivalis]|uniref:Uncharacterized protein n=1 Tax=Chitinophaga nivalis TaxID=2991709 RepID=A0ABT3INI1_9BACT|nr:Pnap_2097 family protein [Chitinophaga nivalis]MCW3465034.1 hypothetical protein [Chitinophaga nivalis]MCW3485274.1 hypothetical protein [Chitinophaga nivalis]